MDSVNFHESDERLELYALRRLPDSEIEHIEEHLLICDSCRDKLDDIAEFALTIRQELKNQTVTPYSPGWYEKWFGWLKPQFAMAGAFAVVVLAAGILWTTGGLTMGGAKLVPIATLQFSATRGDEIQTVGQSRETDMMFTDV